VTPYVKSDREAPAVAARELFLSFGGRRGEKDEEEIKKKMFEERESIR